MSKNNLLVFSCTMLSSKENNQKLLSICNPNTNQIMIEDHHLISVKCVKILNSIIEKTKCYILIIDDILHRDFLNRILTIRGFKYENKIINIINKNMIDEKTFSGYKKIYNIFLLTQKNIYSNIPYLKINPELGLTLNDKIKIISHFLQQPYKWIKTRQLKSNVDMEKLFETYGKTEVINTPGGHSIKHSLTYCWN